jgi:hypothetical protein
MAITLSDVLDDIYMAEQGLHKFERKYWISSDHFYELYSQGMLDDGQHAEDFAEWAGHYKLKQKRQIALQQISSRRMNILRQQRQDNLVRLTPAEPTIEPG